jgi:hypothetical protein
MPLITAKLNHSEHKRKFEIPITMEEFCSIQQQAEARDVDTIHFLKNFACGSLFFNLKWGSY